MLIRMDELGQVCWRYIWSLLQASGSDSEYNIEPPIASKTISLASHAPSHKEGLATVCMWSCLLRQDLGTTNQIVDL